MNLSHYSKNAYLLEENFPERLDFSFLSLTIFGLFSKNIISGIGSYNYQKIILDNNLDIEK